MSEHNVNIKEEEEPNDIKDAGSSMFSMPAKDIAELTALKQREDGNAGDKARINDLQRLVEQLQQTVDEKTSQCKEQANELHNQAKKITSQTVNINGLKDQLNKQGATIDRCTNEHVVTIQHLEGKVAQLTQTGNDRLEKYQAQVHEELTKISEILTVTDRDVQAALVNIKNVYEQMVEELHDDLDDMTKVEILTTVCSGLFTILLQSKTSIQDDPYVLDALSKELHECNSSMDKLIEHLNDDNEEYTLSGGGPSAASTS
jgi:ElaB/YqjD/DUF883 family membrane-anchored ribosome-binding protein